jgi:excisionase family DNA binding protein
MIVLDGDEFLTVEEAATRLGIKPASLYAYVSRGVIRSYRQGIKRQRLYRRAEVEALLRVAPAGDPAPLPSHEDRPRKRRIPDIPLAESWIRE